MFTFKHHIADRNYGCSHNQKRQSFKTNCQQQAAAQSSDNGIAPIEIDESRRDDCQNGKGDLRIVVVNSPGHVLWECSTARCNQDQCTDDSQTMAHHFEREQAYGNECRHDPETWIDSARCQLRKLGGRKGLNRQIYACHQHIRQARPMRCVAQRGG